MGTVWAGRGVSGRFPDSRAEMGAYAAGIAAAKGEQGAYAAGIEAAKGSRARMPQV